MRGARLVGLGAYDASDWTYDGPDWPRVIQEDDGTRTLWWNELQPVNGAPVAIAPVSCAQAMADPSLDARPGVLPGIIECMGHRYLWTPAPNVQGGALQWWLHPNSRGPGVILTDSGWELYVSEGYLPREWAPDTEGPPALPEDWMRGFGTFDPLTGLEGPRYDRFGGWEDGEWFILEEGAWVPIDAAARPFVGGPPCFAWLSGTLVQFPCEPTPDGHEWGPGEGPYAGATPANPYYPFQDPASPWYGHPVVTLPPTPNPDAWVPEPCPDGYTRDPEDLTSECFPIPGEVPGEEPLECPPGYELTPEGNCLRITPGTPGEPGGPEPIPCYDAATGRNGTIDPETGECVPAGGGAGPGPAAAVSPLVLAGGALALLLLAGDR